MIMYSVSDMSQHLHTLASNWVIWTQYALGWFLSLRQLDKINIKRLWTLISDTSRMNMAMLHCRSHRILIAFDLGLIIGDNGLIGLELKRLHSLMGNFQIQALLSMILNYHILYCCHYIFLTWQKTLMIFSCKYYLNFSSELLLFHLDFEYYGNLFESSLLNNNLQEQNYYLHLLGKNIRNLSLAMYSWQHVHTQLGSRYLESLLCP